MSSDELDQAEAARLRSALRARADKAPVRPPGVHQVRQLGALRRRRRASIALGVASLAVLGGLFAINNRRDPVPTESEGTPAPAATTTVVDRVPTPDAIPLPTIGAYPRDPALGPQPTKVSYTVKEGDTIESIASALGADPATIRTQTGGTIAVGQVLSLLIGPPPAAPGSIPGAGNVPVVLSGG